jgi:hypothetical protein
LIAPNGSFDGYLPTVAFSGPGRHDVDPTTFPVKLHLTGNQRKESIIFALTDAFAGMIFIANLTNQDIPSDHRFTPEPLYTTTLGIGIPPIATGPLSFFMCHRFSPKIEAPL